LLLDCLAGEGGDAAQRDARAALARLPPTLREDFERFLRERDELDASQRRARTKRLQRALEAAEKPAREVALPGLVRLTGGPAPELEMAPRERPTQSPAQTKYTGPSR
jgi:hypothetical protein